MAEWSNAAVLKTVDLNGSGGSNPSLSANKSKKWRRACSNAIFRFCLQRPAAGGEGCAKERSDCANPIERADVRGSAKERSDCANPGERSVIARRHWWMSERSDCANPIERADYLTICCRFVIFTPINRDFIYEWLYNKELSGHSLF